MKTFFNAKEDFKKFMKEEKKKAKMKVKGEGYQSIKDRILIILSQRNDVTITMMAKLLNISNKRVDSALTSLRKIGIRIWPSKGPGTPLKIVHSEVDFEKYLDWRNNLYLGTAKRMIQDAHEGANKYSSLSGRDSTLLSTLSNATNENHGV